MMFGLATEGVTDQAVLKNILYGYLHDKIVDVEDEIKILQPAFDQSTMTQMGHGSWTSLLAYLRDSRFREDVINHDNVIIQIDTDISQEKTIAVDVNDETGTPLTPTKLIEAVEIRLISEINEGRQGFYEDFENKIIFCITVHSLECWLISFYETNPHGRVRIVNCEDALSRYINRYDPIRDANYRKEYTYYKKLSKDLRRKKNILASCSHNESFQVFINHLDAKFP